MDAQLIVIIAGVILVVAIIGSLLFLKGYSGKFTFDTANGTRPRATEGEGSTSGTKSNGRFKLLTAGVGAVFAAIIAKLWSMQMVSADHYDKLAEQNQTRTVTTPAPRGRILDRNGEAIVDNRASLALVAYRDLAENTVVVRHLANVLGMPYMAVLRNIQDNTEGAQSPHTIASDVRRSTIAYVVEHIDQFPGVSVAERTERSYPNGTLACHVVATPEQSRKSSSMRRRTFRMRSEPAPSITSRATSWGRRVLSIITRACCRAFAANRRSRSMPMATLPAGGRRAGKGRQRHQAHHRS